MVVGPDTARRAKPEDYAEIDALLEAAFDQRGEADLVRRLRADGDMVQEFIMSWAQDANWTMRIGAYAAMSRMVAPKNWFCLGPVAVWPEWQNGALAKGHPLQNSFRFGSRLVRMIASDFAEGGEWFLRLLERAGLSNGPETPTLVVLGKPSFYARAGFSLERAARLTSPYPISHTLIARAGDDVPKRQLIYPPAFADL